MIASGLEWVSLWPNEYASNFLGPWAAQLRSRNVIRAPTAPRRTHQSTSVILPRSPSRRCAPTGYFDKVDELHLLVHPIVVGHGKKLFADRQTVPLELKSATTFETDVLHLVYTIPRATSA